MESKIEKEIKKDAIFQVFGQQYLDDFHPADSNSNERLYRHLKASACNKFINKEASFNKVFLDAGAGQGPYTFLASKKFKTVYCFEFNAKELEDAKRNVGNLNNIVFKQVDLTNIPLEDNTIDTAICSEVLEHIPLHEKAAKELYRVIKPGGRLFFSMPNKNSMFYKRVAMLPRIKLLKTKNQSTLDHGDWEALRHVSFSSKDIETIVTTAGFKIVDRVGVNIISLPGFMRRLLLKSKYLLSLFVKLQEYLAHPLARYGAFYFLELTK